MQMSGLLSAFPPAELLQWAHNDQITGTLVLRRSSREKRILLRNGRIVGCLSNERYDFYGQFLLAGGYVTEHEMLMALSACEESQEGLRLGEALTQLGILDEETVVKTLLVTTEQAIIDVFLWPRGVFFLLEDEPAPAKLEMPPIDPITLVLEGVRQIDEVGRIRERLPHDAVILAPGPAWPGEGLPKLAQRITGVFEPDQTLSDLHEATGGGYCQFLTETDRLLQAGVFEIDTLGDPDPDTNTLSLLDIMLDRVQDDRQATIGATVAMPIAVLGQLYPLWLDHGDESAQQQVLGNLKDFALGLDGSRQLDGLLSAEPRTRDEQLEWLWLRMGGRRLVLLPHAADEVLRARLTRDLVPS
jgi:hypothetical protein